jgi:hypothetical protein
MCALPHEDRAKRFIRDRVGRYKNIDKLTF